VRTTSNKYLSAAKGRCELGVVWRWWRDSENVLLNVEEVSRLIDSSLECASEVLSGERVVARNGSPGRWERHGVGHFCGGRG
jgi:hypothetical protein